MCLKKNLLLLFFFQVLFSFAQNHWATKVLAYQFGTSQIVGQDSAHFPKNVLGAINPSVTANVPANTPNEIVSLGKNGWVALSFEGNIIDEAGADFTVFENAFQFVGGIFDEWLIVSVSQDGNTWFNFPYDSLTGAGMAGRTPTNGLHANSLDPLQSGGDSFDLADLGLPWAKYVKITDATKFQTPDRLSAELDGVVAIHLQTMALTPPQKVWDLIHFQYTENEVIVSAEKHFQLQLWGINGQKLMEREIFPSENLTLMIGGMAKGVYIWYISDEKNAQYIKWAN